MRATRSLILCLIFILVLSGCSLTSGEQQPSPPPPSDDVIASVPTEGEPEDAAPTTAPGSSETFAAGIIAPGEVAFVSNGQVWAVGSDGAGARQVTSLTVGAVLRELTLSPGGRYLALTLDGAALVILDLVSGTGAMYEVGDLHLVGPLVWSAAGDALVYGKIELSEESVPLSSEIWRIVPGRVDGPEMLASVDMTEWVEWSPLFALPDGGLVFSEYAVDSPSGRLRLLAADGTMGEVFAELGTSAILDAVTGEAELRLLLVDQLEPSVLLVAPLSLSEGLLEGSAIPAGEDGLSFTEARFDAAGVRFAALGYRPADSTLAREVQVFSPVEGGYQAVTLSGEAADAVSFDWFNDGQIVVQGLNAESGASELWLLPIDGSPGVFLANGELPVAISAGEE